MRQVAGDRQQLELERQPERIERGVAVAGPPVQHVEEARQPANARWFGSGSTKS